MLNNEELCILLAHRPTSTKQIMCHIMEAKLKLDGIAKPTDNKERDPPTVKHAQCSKYWNEWLLAMHEELEALKAKDIYKEVNKLPPGKKAIQSKWVLHIKHDEDGQISRFKGRLVAKGSPKFSAGTTHLLSPQSHVGSPSSQYYALQP